MTAHIKFPKIDPDFPATLSKIFVQQILREELKYRGLVVTDDLGMGALAQTYPTAEIPVMALEAGCDLLCYCNEFENFKIGYDAVAAAVKSGRISAARIESSVRKVAELKRENLNLVEADPKPFADSAALIGHPITAVVRCGSGGQRAADLLA